MMQHLEAGTLLSIYRNVLAIIPYKIFIPALAVLAILYISFALFMNYQIRRKRHKNQHKDPA